MSSGYNHVVPLESRRALYSVMASSTNRERFVSGEARALPCRLSVLTPTGFRVRLYFGRRRLGWAFLGFRVFAMPIGYGVRPLGVNDYTWEFRL
jgi:hypothetical protein